MRKQTESLLWAAVIVSIFAVGLSDPIVWEWLAGNWGWLLGMSAYTAGIFSLGFALGCFWGERAGHRRGFDLGMNAPRRKR